MKFILVPMANERNLCWLMAAVAAGSECVASAMNRVLQEVQLYSTMEVFSLGECSA